MTLYKIKDFFPNYQQEDFAGKDIKKYTVYAGTTEARVGFVQDVLVDETGQFRYFVVETGFWIFGKKVLLPIGRSIIDSENECIYALGIQGIKQAEIEKQAVVREEVSVRKEVERDTVTASETLRKEELEVDTNDSSLIKKE